MRVLATVTAVWLFGLPSALAQSADWLVLPTAATDDIAWMQPTVSKLSRELRRQGVGVWASRRAVARLEERGPAPPTVISESEVESWLAQSKQGVFGLASGDNQVALLQLEEAQAFSREAFDALNREPEQAQKVLDTCLYLVRALMETGDRQGAVIQSRECVQVVPAGVPTPYMHPPNVLQLYEAALEPGPSHTGTLLVESEPPGCALRVNGVLVGETPVELDNLYPGEYRVQVECDSELGLVHIVEVAPGSTSLFVFGDFDRSLRFEPILHLQHGEQPALQRLARDARELARALPAAAVVLASVVEAGVLELRLATGTEMGSAFARVTTSASGPNTAAIVSAADALLARECKDFTGDEPVAVDCTTGRPLAPDLLAGAGGARARPPRGQFVAGLALGSVGAASLLTGYGLIVARKFAGDSWISDPMSLDAQAKWQHMGATALATGAIGSGLLVTAMPLVLPYEAKTPWWAWLSGGLGVGAAAASIAIGVTADAKPSESCSAVGPDPTACVERNRQTDLAILLGLTAAPLLTMPLVFLLRKPEKKLNADLSPSVRASRRGASVGVSGVF